METFDRSKERELLIEAAAIKSNAAQQELASAEEEAAERRRPFRRMLDRLSIGIDGNEWCVLLGENLQDGVAGFGDSPEAASRAFDAAWMAKLPGKEAGR